MDHGSQTFRRFASVGRSCLATVRALLRNDDGVTAVEFALLAPLLIFSILATVDLGLAISERLTIGHILRAGAQSATEDVGTAKIDLILRATAAKNMTVAAAGAAGTDKSLSLAVRRFCACAAQPSVAVACTTTCSPSAPTQIFYVLTGSKNYAGLILPRFAQSKTLEVQVR